MRVPERIDGAKVILYTENRATNNFGYVQYPDHNETITGMAIAKYENSSEYYLFDCDLQWNVIGDTLHDSIDEAIQAAANSNKINEGIWIEL